jgi:integrase
MRSSQPWYRKSKRCWYVWFNGRQRSLGGDKKQAYEEWSRLTQSGVTTDYTVQQIIQAYWAWAQQQLAESTLERRKPILDSFSNAMRPTLKVSALRAMHVQDWIDAKAKQKVVVKRGKRGERKLSNSPLSPTTVGDYVTLIKGVMNWAVRMGYVDRNPIAAMPRPTARVRQEYVPADLWPRVLELATDEPFRDYLIVMLSTGARATEIFTFEAQHLNGNRLILPIEKSKGRRRSRVVYLPDQALAIVKRYANLYPTGALFRNADGDAWTRNAIRCRFRRLRQKLGMPGLVATTLRHSFTHWRLTSGQDSLTVSKLLGHVDTRMIATRYGHLEANAEFMTAAANQVAFPS